MSIQNKKGFTLIELMVVIVIIGILAAIAIPKLFGMSAKAKAQEVGPAMGTWAKMQQAYRMEMGTWGSAKLISYKLPGETGQATDTTDVDSSWTTNFGYKTVPNKDTASTASLTATMKFTTDDCTANSQWIGEFNDKSGDTPLMTNGCAALTPNFDAIGKKNTKTP